MRGYGFCSYCDATFEICIKLRSKNMIVPNAGLCMSICRGFCGLEFLEKCWASAKMDVPKVCTKMTELVMLDWMRKMYAWIYQCHAKVENNKQR